MARRKRGDLSQDDKEVWAKVAKTTEPLRESSPIFEPEKFRLPQPTKPTKPYVKPLTRIGKKTSEAKVTVKIAIDPMKALDRSSNTMDRKSYDRLRKGKIRPDAKIDLHGMTVAEAHSKLNGFIHRSYAAHKRLVLVITGKGKRDNDEHSIMPDRIGKLRHSVPHWLNMPNLKPMILEITPAHQKHGGGGAYYVYLRRQRNK